MEGEGGSFESGGEGEEGGGELGLSSGGGREEGGGCVRVEIAGGDGSRGGGRAEAVAERGGCRWGGGGIGGRGLGLLRARRRERVDVFA